MTEVRKTSEARLKELRMAILRLERGASPAAARLTIAAVAREAKVSTALIHNHYPEIAEEIRARQGASSRQQRDAKEGQLQAERAKVRTLRAELKNAELRIRRLASINEMLLVENARLQAQAADGKVVKFRSQG